MKKLVYLICLMFMMGTVLTACGDEEANNETTANVQQTTTIEDGSTEDKESTTENAGVGESTTDAGASDETTDAGETLETTTVEQEETTSKEEETTKKQEETTSKPEADVSYGTDGAKLLLAKQRLDGSKIKNFNTKLASREAIATGSMYNSIMSAAQGVRQSAIALSYLSGSKVNVNNLICTNFADYCNYADYYQSYMRNMDGMVERNVTLINYIKNYVKVVDKWIVSGEESYLLQVEDNSETVYVKSKDGYTVFKRYTNDKAQNVYEMYIDEEIAPGQTTKVKFTVISELRYEYTEFLNHAEASKLAIVAEKDNGYWNFFSISSSDEHANVNNLIMLDDIYYEASHYVNVDPNHDTLNYLNIMTADFKYDIMGIKDNEIELRLTGFTGVKEVKGVDTDNGSITLNNGTTILAGDTLCDGKAKLSFAAVQELSEVLYPTVCFMIEGETLEERFVVLEQLFEETGIRCKVDFKNIVNKTLKIQNVVNEFKSNYKWNGTRVSTYNEVKTAYVTEEKEMNEMAAKYNNVKGAAVATEDELNAVSEPTNFTKIKEPQFGMVTYNNGKIFVSGMVFTLGDNCFVEKGMEYTIGMDLVRLEADGTMTVEESFILGSADAKYTKCEDRMATFTVCQDASYTMPEELYDGEYVLTAYVCTKEGIRVSEMLKVSMTGDVNDSIDKESCTVKIGLDANKNMIVTYATKIEEILE